MSEEMLASFFRGEGGRALGEEFTLCKENAPCPDIPDMARVKIMWRDPRAEIVTEAVLHDHLGAAFSTVIDSRTASLSPLLPPHTIQNLFLFALKLMDAVDIPNIKGIRPYYPDETLAKMQETARTALRQALAAICVEKSFNAAVGNVVPMPVIEAAELTRFKHEVISRVLGTLHKQGFFDPDIQAPLSRSEGPFAPAP